MGRPKIKKKAAVLPFRETVAFRFIMVGIAAIFFLLSSYQLLRAFGSGDTRLLIIASVLTLGSAALALFNLAQVQKAKIPKSAQERMKRARR